MRRNAGKPWEVIALAVDCQPWRSERLGSLVKLMYAMEEYLPKRDRIVEAIEATDSKHAKAEEVEHMCNDFVQVRTNLRPNDFVDAENALLPFVTAYIEHTLAFAAEGGTTEDGVSHLTKLGPVLQEAVTTFPEDRKLKEFQRTAATQDVTNSSNKRQQESRTAAAALLAEDEANLLDKEKELSACLAASSELPSEGIASITTNLHEQVSTALFEATEEKWSHSNTANAIAIVEELAGKLEHKEAINRTETLLLLRRMTEATEACAKYGTYSELMEADKDRTTTAPLARALEDWKTTFGTSKASHTDTFSEYGAKIAEECHEFLNAMAKEVEEVSKTKVVEAYKVLEKTSGGGGDGKIWYKDLEPKAGEEALLAKGKQH